MSDRPPKLYKYQRLDAQTLRNLKAQSIYFGSPRGFNDPYDCALTPNIKRPTVKEVEAIRAQYLNDRELTAQQRHEIENAPASQWMDILHRAAHSAFLAETENS